MSNGFLDLLRERRDDYKAWVPVYCVAVHEYVYFNMQGFGHLRFKIDNTPRNPKEAMYNCDIHHHTRIVCHHKYLLFLLNLDLLPMLSV